jgi:cyclohexadienyl dehydratase
MKRQRATLIVGLFVFGAACARPPAPAAEPKPVATIRVGTSGEDPPMSTWTGRGPTGFAPALVESFAAASKEEVAWSRFRWPELSDDLAARRFDVAADGVTVEPERSIVGRYTVPIARGGGAPKRETTALWVGAGREDLAEQLDDWLLAEEASGRLSALRQRYLGAAAGAPSAEPVNALLAATSERLSLMPFVAGAKMRAGVAVEDRAQEERVLARSRDYVAKAAAAIGRPPPPGERVDAFFRAQIEAAKAIQRTTPPLASRFSLDRDLRPAIDWVTRRMAALIVRIDSTHDVVARAHEELEENGLDAAHADAIGRSMAAIALGE